MKKHATRKIYFAGKNDENAGILVAPFAIGEGESFGEMPSFEKQEITHLESGTQRGSPEALITISAPLLEVGELRTVVVQGPIPQILFLHEKLVTLTKKKYSELQGDKYSFIGSWVDVRPFVWKNLYLYKEFSGATTIADVTKVFDEKPYLQSNVTGIQIGFALWDKEWYGDDLLSQALPLVLRRDLALEENVKLRTTYAALEIFKGRTVGKVRKTLPKNLQEGNEERTPIPLLYS